MIVDDSGSGFGAGYPALDYTSNETVKVADIYCEGENGCVTFPVREEASDEDATVVESSGSASGSGSSPGSGSSTSSGSGSSMSVGDDSGSSSMFMQMGDSGSGDIVPEESGDDEVEVVADVYCGSNDNTTGCEIITDPYNDANKVTEVHEGYEHVGVIGRGTIGGVENTDGYYKDNGTETGNVTHAGTVVYSGEYGVLGGFPGDPLNQEEESGSGSGSDEEGSGEESSEEAADEGDIYCTGTDCEIVITSGRDSIQDVPAPYKSDDADEVVAE